MSYGFISLVITFFSVIIFIAFSFHKKHLQKEDVFSDYEIEEIKD